MSRLFLSFGFYGPSILFHSFYAVLYIWWEVIFPGVTDVFVLGVILPKILSHVLVSIS